MEHQSDQPITEARIKAALLAVAHVISKHGRTEYGALLERLERELLMYREARDPVSRARRILDEDQAAREKSI